MEKHISDRQILHHLSPNFHLGFQSPWSKTSRRTPS